MDFIQTLYEIAKDICRPIARRLRYAISLPKKFTELNKRLTNLCQRRDDIKAEIVRVNLQKGPTSECNGWIAEVGEIEEKVKKIEEQHLVSKRCLKGCFPDVIARVRLGEDVEEMIERVKELQEKSNSKSWIVTDLPIAKVEMMPVPPKLGAEALIRRTLQKILDHMRDEKIQKIGIWGKGGVGKTTLMGLLNNMPEIRQMFQIVIWVTVSKSWSIRKIQDEVAERLSLKITNDSNERFSDERVRQKLSLELEGKKYLLLLDDVWEFINLADVGIPSANQNNGSKVVLTTREFGVCRGMETDVEFSVETLPREEAQKMFESIVERDIATLPIIQPIAQEIVRKCGGLPLAIKVVGRALRKEEDVSIWRNLLRKLQSPDLSYVKDMSNNVFTTLKASYDHLDLHDPNSKDHFLYCGLYPEDHEIKKSQLIRYWRAEGLLSSECTLAEAGDEGRAILRDLVDASLLEKCEDDNHVKMHDVIRDFVLNLTSPEGGEKSKHVVRAGLSKQERVLEWSKASRISFMYTKGYSLPEKPICPKLLTLLLQSDHAYSSSVKTIPKSFFNHMPSLQVLDLSGSGIHSLPSSMSNLVSLRALLLKRCGNLDALPREINALKRLEVIEVTRHSMRGLATEIWELTSLKCLTLKSARLGILMEVMIPSGKISKLSQLEQFNLSGHLSIRDEGSVRVVAEELSSLTRLSSLVFDFGSVNNLTLFLENSKAWRDQSLKKFKFFVGAKYKHSCPTNISGHKRGLEYVIDDGEGDEGGSSNSIVSSAVLRDVIKRSDFLKIGRIGKLLVKLSDLGGENISGLKACGIWRCRYLETLADEDGMQEDAFANLEHLNLIQLFKLRSIFFSEISPIRKNMPLKDNFKALRILYVDRCLMLKQLFSSRGLLLQLLNLEHVEILYCEILEEMISVDDYDVDEINSTSWVEYWSPLPKLKYLSLVHLEEFVSIFSISKRIISPLRWPSLEKLCLDCCPKLKRYPFGAADDLPALKKLEFREMPEFVGFSEPGDVSNTRRRCWSSLEELCLYRCPKLKIFPFGAHADDFQTLKSLRLEQLSEFAGFREEGDVPYSFWFPSLLELRLMDCPKLQTVPLGPHNLPKLKLLRLEELPQLVSFGNRTRNDNNNNNNNNNASSLTTTMCWESLKTLRFDRCPKLEIFPFSVDSAPNLEKIASSEELKWQDDATKLRFTPLKVILWTVG